MSDPKNVGRTSFISFRVSEVDKKKLEERALAAAKAGYYKTRSKKEFSLSQYIMFVLNSHLQDQ